MKTKTILFVLLVFISAKTNGQWQADTRLSDLPSQSITSINNAWCVAASGNVVHVIWSDYRDGGTGEIYYKHSTDGGISWGADTRLTNDPAFSSYPSVAISGSVVHVIWLDTRDVTGGIYYKRSADDGITWGADTRLIPNNLGVSGAPSVAVSGSAVHLVWVDSRDANSEIYYKNSTDGGISWGTDTRLTNDPGRSVYPSVAVSGLDVHVAWIDDHNVTSNFEIYYKHSTDGGVTWGADTRLTNDPAASVDPSISVSGSFVHVVWRDLRDMNNEIYYKRSTDGGVTWGADTRLTNNVAISESPSVTVSGSIVHLIWDDGIDGNPEIYYKRSTDGGVSWGADTRLTNNPASLSYPSVAVSGSTVHIVWSDQRDGHFEVYYNRNPSSNIPLPVRDLKLAGSWKNNAASLNWTTTAEYDNDHFDIERKYPQENNFSKISSIRTKHTDGNSQSLTAYAYSDTTANAGAAMLLYRLKQIDKNGQYMYSKTITIRPDAKKEFILTIYPTVAAGSSLFIQAGNLDLQKMQVQVFDMRGSLIINQQLAYQSQLLPLPVMSSGMYRLVVQSGEWKYSRMFVK